MHFFQNFQLLYELQLIDMEIITNYSNKYIGLNSTMDGDFSNATSVQMSLLDQSMGRSLLLVAVYVGTLMVLGTLGNIVVVFIYVVRWREETIKYFIGSLASLDLITSAICMPLELSMLVHPVTMDNDVLCKVTRFSRAFTSLSSGFLLVIIAFDRFKRICRFGHHQFTTFAAKVLCIIAISLGLIFAIPSLVVFGRFNRTNYDIIETACSVSGKMEGNIFPLIYYVILVALFIGMSTSLFVLYILVGVKLHRLPHRRRMMSLRPASASCDASSTHDQDSNKQEPKNKSIKEDIRIPRADTLPREPKNKMINVDTIIPRADSLPRFDDALLRKEKAGNPIIRHYSFGDLDRIRKRVVSTIQSAEKRTRARNRMSLTLFVITALVVIAYLPYVILVIANSVIDDFLPNLSTSSQVAYNIGIVSHFLSSALNPFVYGFCSKNFRTKLSETHKDISYKLESLRKRLRSI